MWTLPSPHSTHQPGQVGGRASPACPVAYSRVNSPTQGLPAWAEALSVVPPVVPPQRRPWTHRASARQADMASCLSCFLAQAGAIVSHPPFWALNPTPIPPGRSTLPGPLGSVGWGATRVPPGDSTHHRPSREKAEQLDAYKPLPQWQGRRPVGGPIWSSPHRQGLGESRSRIRT